MIPLALAGLILVGVGGTAYALTREHKLSRESEDGKTPRFRGLLKTGKMYRVWARVSPAFAERVKKSAPSGVTPQAALTEAVKESVTRSGFSPIVLVTNDPTDNQVWTVLGRWSLRSSEAFDSEDVRLFQLQETEEPPQGLISPKTQGEGSSCLDVGLTDEEVFAVRFAIAYDESPKHLGGLGTTFDPDYPIAAGLLYAKAALADVEAYGSRGLIHARSFVDLLARLTTALGPDVKKGWKRYERLMLTREQYVRLKNILGKLEGHVRRRGQKAPPPVTAAALQLALATRRPELSLVADRDVVTGRVKEINRLVKKGHPQAREAAIRLERANKLLERRNWIDTYRRDEAAMRRQHGFPPPGSLTRRT